MKYLLVFLLPLLLNSCFVSTQRCETLPRPEDNYIVKITSGNAQGSYYCVETHFKTILVDCIEIKSKRIDKNETCPDLRDVKWDLIRFDKASVVRIKSIDGAEDE